MRTGSNAITPDHLVLGILRHRENMAFEMISETSLSPELLKLEITDKIRQGDSIIPYELSNKVTFNEDTQNILKIMYLEARRDGMDQPNSIHLLLSILRFGGVAVRILEQAGFTYQTLKSKFDGEKLNNISMDNLDKDFEVDETIDEYEEDFEEEFEEDFEDEENDIEETKDYYLRNADAHKNGKTNEESTRRGGSKSLTPMIDRFGVDLTRAAAEDLLDPVVGRNKEVERVAQILGRRKKNNPIIIGEPGVGKSAIVEALAIRIANKNISRTLAKKRIISLDIGSVVAGTKFRGQFEERIKSILNELKNNPDVILFIDEMHTIVGAGGAVGSLDAANMLKPALARGEIQCIGATTLDEFRQVIEKDGALERRFQKVMIEPTSFEETYDILTIIKERYEKYHNVTYSEEALKACINLSIRYITDRCLPDKAIDVLDEVGSRTMINNLKIPKNILKLEKDIEQVKSEKREVLKKGNIELAGALRETEVVLTEKLEKSLNNWKEKSNRNYEVTPDDVSEVMSMMTGIPLSKIATSESNKLLTMDSVIKKKVIGQDEAVDKVVKAIRRSRAGIKDPNKPNGTFLFLGPTGVGKTQLAKVLAEYLFDSPEALIRIDMSEYMEKFALSRLIGAPPGYVGYEDGGQLSERVRRKPYSVVLLDEIEKAHPDIFNILLQVLDEGRLTDSNGRYIDFRNTILILTSNIGSRELKEFGSGVGFETTSKKDIKNSNKSIVDKAINKTFSVEFINRLDDQILFNPLSKADIEKIIDIELNGLYKRVEQVGFKLIIDKKAKSFIAQEGYDPRFGARPLKRAIQKYVEDAVSEIIISRSHSGATLKLVLNKEKDGLEIKIEDKNSNTKREKALI